MDPKQSYPPPPTYNQSVYPDAGQHGGYYPPVQQPAYPAAPGSHYPPAGQPAGYYNTAVPVPQAGVAPPPGFVNVNQNMAGADPAMSSVAVTQPVDNFGNSFSDKVIRMRFIQRVYLILTCQLLVTVGTICLFIFNDNVKYYAQNNLGLYIAAYVVFLVTYIALICCAKLRMKFPTNFILLSIFTLALSYMVGMISSYHKTEIVLFSMGICAACCFCVSIFAIQTKFDFTKLGGCLCMLLLVIIIFGIFAIIMRSKIMTIVYSGLIALVFMGFLAYDTQMVIGGRKRKYELSPEEYINGALQLYMDVINIFLAILSLTSSSTS